MRIAVGLLCVVMPFASLFSAVQTSNAVPRVYVSPFKTAASVCSVSHGETNGNWQVVALGAPLMTSRLARPGAPFICVADAKNATYILGSVLTTLRSKENVYSSTMYKVETKTTNWQIDLIVQLTRLADDAIVFSKTVTGFCNEQRPISEAKFDNDLFHTLMVAAIEEAAEDILEYFEPETVDSVSSVADAPIGNIRISGGKPEERAGAAATKERESLAVLKPKAGDGVSDSDAVMLWDFLESKLGGGEYSVVSRADVSRMMEEVGLTTSSYLSDPVSRKRARVGRLATVSKLLAPSFGRFGNRYLLMLKIFDSSTAEIDGTRTESVSSEDLDGLLPLAAEAMRRLLAPTPQGMALAFPVISVPRAPSWLADSVANGVKSALAKSGIAVETEGAKAAVTLVPSVPVYSLRLVNDEGKFRYRGDVQVSLSADGLPPVSVELADIDLGLVEGAVPSWVVKDRGEKLLAAAFEKLSRKLSSFRAK